MRERSTSDPFQTRLAGLVQVLTEPADRPIDALAVARGAMTGSGGTRASTTGVRFVGVGRRRAWLMVLGAVGILVALAVAGVGGRPTSSAPRIEKLAYIDPDVGVALEEPAGAPQKVIVAGERGVSPQGRECLTTDLLAGRSTCWTRIALAPGARHLALRSSDHVISILTTEGRETAQVTDRQDEFTPPRWSPVEDVMAVISGGGFELETELDIVDAGGQVTKRIVLPMEVGSIHGWSPDGRRILVDGCMPEPSVARPGYCWQGGAAGAWELWAVDVVTGEPVRLTDTPSVKESWSDWSPDGSRIAYTSDCEDAVTPDVPCHTSVWTVRPDGSDRRRLTPDGDGSWFPVWAPDGERLAFSRSTTILPDNPADNVVVSEADGSTVHQVTAFETGYARVVGWSPDGSTLVVTYWRPARSNGETDESDVVQTWLIGADGSDARILVPGTDDVDMTWADPD